MPQKHTGAQKLKGATQREPGRLLLPVPKSIISVSRFFFVFLHRMNKAILNAKQIKRSKTYYGKPG